MALWLVLQWGRRASRWPGSASSPSVAARAPHRSWEPQPLALTFWPPAETRGRTHMRPSAQAGVPRAHAHLPPCTTPASPRPYARALAAPDQAHFPATPCSPAGPPVSPGQSLGICRVVIKHKTITSNRKRGNGPTLGAKEALRPTSFGKLTGNVGIPKLGPGPTVPFIVTLYTFRLCCRLSLTCIQYS